MKQKLRDIFEKKKYFQVFITLSLVFFLTVKCAGNKSAFFADKLNLAMKASVTRHIIDVYIYILIVIHFKLHLLYMCWTYSRNIHQCDFVFAQGSGYKGKILTRILVSRSEIDLAKIKQEYQNKFGKSLYQDIQVNTVNLS